MPSTDSLIAKRTVLLFDTDQHRRDRRADQLRNRGMEVTCASDSTEARMMWLRDSFRLVLIETRDSPGAIDFSSQIRSERPKQRLAFFVDGPGYLSATPATPPLVSEPPPTDGFGLLLERACALLSHPNGFREASLRILAARFAAHHRRHSREISSA